MRSSQGSAAYVALRVSTEPFNDAAADEPSDKAVKQAWDMHGFVKTDKPKAQVLTCTINFALLSKLVDVPPIHTHPLSCAICVLR